MVHLFHEGSSVFVLTAFVNPFVFELQTDLSSLNLPIYSAMRFLPYITLSHTGLEAVIQGQSLVVLQCGHTCTRDIRYIPQICQGLKTGKASVLSQSLLRNEKRQSQALCFHGQNTTLITSNTIEAKSAVRGVVHPFIVSIFYLLQCHSCS